MADFALLFRIILSVEIVCETVLVYIGIIIFQV